MRADLVVVLLIRFEQMTKVLFAEDDQVIKAVSPDRADEPLRISILPRRLRRDRSIPYAHGSKAPDESLGIRAIPIADYVP
jgi:hypothetical protein